MNPSEHIINVSDSDFQYEVVAYSNQTPVVVEFWAEWCGPCKILGPVLEKLAKEEQGAFRLAKVNVDSSPNLTMQFQVQGIPLVKAFRDGQVVAEFTGARAEPEVREFLRGLAPNPGDLELDKGISLLAGGDWEGAAQALNHVLNASPDNSAALLGLSKTYLAQGSAAKALPILRQFPASKEYSVAEQLIPLAQAMVDLEDDASPIEEKDDELRAFQHALRLISLGNFPAAIDGMLDILRKDKNFLNGEARKITVGMLHVLGDDNPQTKTYRSELSSLLF